MIILKYKLPFRESRSVDCGNLSISLRLHYEKCVLFSINVSKKDIKKFKNLFYTHQKESLSNAQYGLVIWIMIDLPSLVLTKGLCVCLFDEVLLTQHVTVGGNHIHVGRTLIRVIHHLRSNCPHSKQTSDTDQKRNQEKRRKIYSTIYSSLVHHSNICFSRKITKVSKSFQKQKQQI